MKIAIVYGTRPEYIKLEPLFRSGVEVIKVNQHTSLLELEGAKFTRSIEVLESSDRLNSIFSSIISSNAFDGIDLLIVQGDTATAAASAIAAFNKKIKIAHVEAGLRTWNKNSPFPEEGYRCIISEIADYHFCPTSLAASNLKKSNVYVTGNTGLDSLLSVKVSNVNNSIPVTLHRSENKHIIDEWLSVINELSYKIGKTFDFYKHPSVKCSEFENIRILPPINRKCFAEVLASSSFVITDSGGIQEEASFFGKKVIVCRDSTERPEGIDSGHLFMCSGPKDIFYMYDKLISSGEPLGCPYGNGRAASAIWNTLDGLSL